MPHKHRGAWHDQSRAYLNFLPLDYPTGQAVRDEQMATLVDLQVDALDRFAARASRQIYEKKQGVVVKTRGGA